ncbi:phage major tail tube protein [Escherichia coli]|nr:phage major tail tube protein [Escherichia coli]
MVGKVELPAGLTKLEGEIKWNSFYRDAMLSAANPVQVAGTAVSFQRPALQLAGADWTKSRWSPS